MFDKLFLQDERVLLYRWDLLLAQFRIVARAGRAAARFRDVFAHTVAELEAVERELVRFGLSPADALPEGDAILWRAAASWVAAHREWASPPADWDRARLDEALGRRKRLEAAVFAAVAAYPADDADDSPDVVTPDAVR
jgi:hypothetical protein